MKSKKAIVRGEMNKKKHEKQKRDVISDGKVLNCTSIYLQI